MLNNYLQNALKCGSAEPLLITGNTGVGKTHLVQTICEEYKEKSGYKFLYRYINAKFIDTPLRIFIEVHKSIMHVKKRGVKSCENLKSYFTTH